MTPTLNIAALTRRTGVPADTIRKWEQRYGVLRPDRTPGGQRRYTEADVARVEWLKARLDEGFRIGEAAALLSSADVVAATPEELRDAFVDAALQPDAQALLSIVDQVLLIDPLEDAFEHALVPALVRVGELWEAGEMSIAQEHLASSAVRCALNRQLADPRGAVRGVTVLACAPGERHEIGLLMLAVLLRADGWQVLYLGADCPVDETIELADRVGASAVCFSASKHETADALQEGLGHTIVPSSLTVLVGGAGTEAVDAQTAIRELRKVAA